MGGDYQIGTMRGALSNYKSELSKDTMGGDRDYVSQSTARRTNAQRTDKYKQAPQRSDKTVLNQETSEPCYMIPILPHMYHVQKWYGNEPQLSITNSCGLCMAWQPLTKPVCLGQG
jgi:hypothetical protein